MRARSSSRKLIMTVALVAVIAAACGSSSKGASSSTTPTSAASSSAGSGTTEAGTPTTAKPKSFSGSSGGSFCDEIRNDQSAFSNSDIATKTPADLKKLYTKLVPELEHAESQAPSAIKGDFATFVTFFKKLNDAFASANYNFENLDPSKFAALDSPAIKTASDNIEQYVVQVCHVAEPTTPTT